MEMPPSLASIVGAGRDALQKTNVRVGAAKTAIVKGAERAGEVTKEAAGRTVNVAKEITGALGDIGHGVVQVTADGIQQIIEIRAAAAKASGVPETLSAEDVFIVHGHDREALAAVKAAIKGFGLNPITLAEEAGALDTIKEKFEKRAYSRGTGFAVALFTPDDECVAKDGTRTRRSRQNVVFELGFFMSAFRGEKCCIVVKGEVEDFSDIDGILKIDMNSRDWKRLLGRELERGGLRPRRKRKSRTDGNGSPPAQPAEPAP